MAQERLRDLKRHGGSEITIFCSHDAKELEALQGLSGGDDRTYGLAPGEGEDQTFTQPA